MKEKKKIERSMYEINLGIFVIARHRFEINLKEIKKEKEKRRKLVNRNSSRNKNTRAEREFGEKIGVRKKARDRKLSKIVDENDPIHSRKLWRLYRKVADRSIRPKREK